LIGIPTQATQAEEKKPGGTLIQQEEREIGEVKGAVYMAYIVALGGAAITIAILLSFLLEQGSKVAADMWVSWWTDDTSPQGGMNHSNFFYLGIYTSIGVANAIASLARGFLTAIAGINSARVCVVVVVVVVDIVNVLLTQVLSLAGWFGGLQTLHDAILTNILRVPMSFFDTTPVGRILNRFSKDQVCTIRAHGGYKRVASLIAHLISPTVRALASTLSMRRCHERSACSSP
jgi:ABC-type multidrug transport system fused ATPase/permease subunit